MSVLLELMRTANAAKDVAKDYVKKHQLLSAEDCKDEHMKELILQIEKLDELWFRFESDPTKLF